MSTVDVYQVGQDYVVSENSVWVEGIYASDAAARAAVMLPVDVLHTLWLRQFPKPLTLADIEKACTDGEHD